MRRFLGLFILIFVGLNIQAQTIDIMSFNIRYDNPSDNENSWDNRKADLLNLINYYRPDFLGIQEGLNHQIEFLAKNMTEYKYIGLGRDDGDTKGEYTAIYYDSTKFELIQTETFWLSETPDTVSVGWDASMERICTYGNFKNIETGGVIHILNTHFDHIGEQSRAMSASLILSKIKDYNISSEQLLVMGDLNCEPKSQAITNFKSELDDGMEMPESTFYGPVGTFNAFDTGRIPNERIDYIFTKNLTVLSYRHIDDRRPNQLCISDHLPILIQVK